MIRLGIDRVLEETELRKRLHGRRVALLGHPASVTSKLVHSLDALCDSGHFKVTAAFGPQHGMRGEKQYNMIESDDYVDPVRKIPVYSLYGAVRRPTKEMMASFDVVLVDLQDVGCRIYTYLTTLHYMLEACAQYKKEIWVLDRPNPAGRPIEGNLLEKGQESFVGTSQIVMRHGLTMGELARWLRHKHRLDVNCEIIEMQGYDPNEGPGFGWPLASLAWVNPSPNIPTLSSARVYAGTVLIEGTNFSEGRGTTRPLEVIGHPQMRPQELLDWMKNFAPQWMQGCSVRSCFFQPTFYKFKDELCAGIQFHADDSNYDPLKFQPFRWVVSFLKAAQIVQPGLLKWREPPYEYETSRLPIDVINGGQLIRNWIDDPNGKASDLDKILTRDEQAWRLERRPHLIYKDG